MNKKIGYIGLGKMGLGMTKLLTDKGWDVVGYNRHSGPEIELAEHGGTGVSSIQAVVEELEGRKLIWVMVPWRAVDAVLAELVPMLSEGDIVIDGGNSPYKESMRRHAALSEKGIKFLDVGVSGGPGGARTGACCMVGGERALFDEIEDLFRDISIENGYGYMGPGGAGHFVKMVHNGIEYGMMQALAEGFDIMKHKSEFDLDFLKICDVYNHGSVIESSLVGWLKGGFEKYGVDLGPVCGTAKHTGEGLWTVKEAHELEIDDEVLHSALTARETSELVPSYQGKLIMAMRNGFGHHDINCETLEEKK
jgi:6-phosphogluconate dehydrogenase